MKVTLLVVAGPHTGRKIVVRDGEIARFGRTEWADYSFPNDAGMTEVHFSIQCSARQSVLSDLRSAAGTWVSGRAVQTVNLATGNVITAGQSRLLVALGDDPLPKQVSASGEAIVEAEQEKAPSQLMVLAAQAKLSEPSLALAEQDQSVAAFAAQLRSEARWNDALAFLATVLPKPVAVAWSSQCLKLIATELKLPWSAGDLRALDVADRWAKEPHDDVAREAEQVAADLQRDTGPSWTAMAAFLGGTSLAPAGIEIVPPPVDGLANAVKAAFVLGLNGVPNAAGDKLRLQFCQLGETLLPKAG